MESQKWNLSHKSPPHMQRIHTAEQYQTHANSKETEEESEREAPITIERKQTMLVKHTERLNRGTWNERFFIIS